MKKFIGVAVLLTAILLTACDNGGGGGTTAKPPDTNSGNNNIGDELWQKLAAGTGTWKNESGETLIFTAENETELGGYQLKVSGTAYPYGSGTVYVKLNSASDPWLGNIYSPKNFTFGGGHTDAGTLTFQSNTKMTLSNFTSNYASPFNGSYTKQ